MNSSSLNKLRFSAEFRTIAPVNAVVAPQEAFQHGQLVKTTLSEYRTDEIQSQLSPDLLLTYYTQGAKVLVSPDSKNPNFNADGTVQQEHVDLLYRPANAALQQIQVYPDTGSDLNTPAGIKALLDKAIDSAGRF